MKNSGQTWALLLAADETEPEASQLLDSVVNRAVRTAHRERVLERDPAARVVLVPSQEARDLDSYQELLS